MPTEVARAKINLTLHVGRAIADMADRFYGYHPLDSLVVFADIGDELSAEPADKTTLTITGPFANDLSSAQDNLILKAYRAVAQRLDCPQLAFHLTKNLPVAAGIGGGSANAAACLRLLQRMIDQPDGWWQEIALGLGADVPVCFLSQTARMTGIGDTVTALPGLGQIWAVLVNSGDVVSTPDIFQAYDKDPHRGTPKPQSNLSDLDQAFMTGRNDLQPITCRISSLTRETLNFLSTVSEQPDHVRMSGSGATCFALCKSEAQADKIVAALEQTFPTWWHMKTRLGDPQ